MSLSLIPFLFDAFVILFFWILGILYFFAQVVSLIRFLRLRKEFNDSLHDLD